MKLEDFRFLIVMANPDPKPKLPELQDLPHNLGVHCQRGQKPGSPNQAHHHGLSSRAFWLNMGIGIITTTLPLWSLYKYTAITHQNPIPIIQAPVVGLAVLGAVSNHALRDQPTNAVSGLALNPKP